MKKFVLLVLSLCILLAVTGCSNVPKYMLDESEYYAYQQDQIYLNPRDAINETGQVHFWFSDYPNEGLATKRGLKIGSSITQVKELYGDFTIVPIESDTPISIREYLDKNTKNNGEILLQLNMFLYDGKICGREEYIKDHSELMALVQQAQSNDNYIQEVSEAISETDIEYFNLDIHIENTNVDMIGVRYYSPEGVKNNFYDALDNK